MKDEKDLKRGWTVTRNGEDWLNYDHDKNKFFSLDVLEEWKRQCLNTFEKSNIGCNGYSGSRVKCMKDADVIINNKTKEGYCKECWDEILYDRNLQVKAMSNYERELNRVPIYKDTFKI